MHHDDPQPHPGPNPAPDSRTPALPSTGCDASECRGLEPLSEEALPSGGLDPGRAAFPILSHSPIFPPAQAAAAREKEKKERSGFVEALVLVMVALVMALTLKTYVAEAYEIKGRSMEKTFLNGQRVVVLKSFYGIQRGDIIVFASSEDPGKDLIKRVVGLPGETVKIDRGQVYINGVRIAEDYAVPDGRDARDFPRTEVVEKDHYFVLGDNRPDSHDSRAFHAIPASSIKGKVVVRWWPLSEMHSF